MQGGDSVKLVEEMSPPMGFYLQGATPGFGGQNQQEKRRRKPNNEFGQKGTKKCPDCRRKKRKCIWSQGEQKCDLCMRTGSQCGKAEFAAAKRSVNQNPPNDHSRTIPSSPGIPFRSQQRTTPFSPFQPETAFREPRPADTYSRPDRGTSYEPSLQQQFQNSTPISLLALSIEGQYPDWNRLQVLEEVARRLRSENRVQESAASLLEPGQIEVFRQMQAHADTSSQGLYNKPTTACTSLSDGELQRTLNPFPEASTPIQRSNSWGGPPSGGLTISANDYGHRYTTPTPLDQPHLPSNSWETANQYEALTMDLPKAPMAGPAPSFSWTPDPAPNTDVLPQPADYLGGTHPPDYGNFAVKFS